MMKRLRRGLPLALCTSIVASAMLMWPGGDTDPAQAAAPGFVPNSALILGSSVYPGTATAGTQFPGGTDTRSLEEEQAQLAGFTTTVVDDMTWSKMTAADFDNYQIIIIGDPRCGSVPLAAIVNASVWQSVVMSSGGNKYLTGTDDEWHHVIGTGGAQSTFVGGPGGAARAVKAGISFAGAVAGATGAYVDLSCDRPAAAFLDGLSVFGPGQFTQGSAPCFGTVSLVADFPGLAGALTSADLSDWGCSAHTFIDKWPADWVPLALATDPDVPDTYSANDISTGQPVHGSPYRLISGSGITVTSDLALSPLTATNPVGTDHTVTATLTQTLEATPSPVAGATITFAISSGPNAGVTGSCVTDANGQCTFTYTGSGGPGTDTIVGSTIVGGATKSATASKTWGAGPTPTATATATATAAGVATDTPTATATNTATATATATVSCVPLTVGQELAVRSGVSVTSTAQVTRTARATGTVAMTQTAEATDTPTPTDTATPTETATSTATRTSTATPTATCTPTATATTPSLVSTATSTVTRTVAATRTASSTAVITPPTTSTFTSNVLGAQAGAPRGGAAGAAQLPNTGGGSGRRGAGTLLAIAALLAALGGVTGLVAMRWRQR